jgi:hypothetical protein
LSTECSVNRGESFRSYFAPTFLSSRQQYSTGTVNSVIMATTMPPKVGMAMGIMMSAPRPVSVSTGSRARMVVAVVIKAGRTRRTAAATVALRTPSTESVARLRKEMSR